MKHFGPYIQVSKLAKQLAVKYEADTGLKLQPLVAHFMEEVEVNAASATFDITDYLERIKLDLESASFVAVDDRQIEFLEAVIGALEGRLRSPDISH